MTEVGAKELEKVTRAEQEEDLPGLEPARTAAGPSS